MQIYKIKSPAYNIVYVQVSMKENLDQHIPVTVKVRHIKK